MKEIGSEFWKPKKQHIQHNESVYLSGRTALDVIIRDAMESRGVSSVLLPSYCCHTMIEPFLYNGVNVRFYDVYVNDDNVLTADIPSPRKNEMLYIMKYFGDTDLHYEGEGKLLSGWAVSVEDMTHSCFNMDYSSQADYWFTSYRKWFAVEGVAVAGKRNAKLPEAERGQNKTYFELRSQAFSLKQQFMDSKFIDKQLFLDVFGQAEVLLSEDYKDFGAGYEEIYDLFRFLDGIEDVHLKRRSNAKLLIDGLAGLRCIKIFSDFQDDKKSPLFVPIIVEEGMRNSLRKYLVSKEIYCPVHWPLSNRHEGLSERATKLYGQELSLVCDQRYSVDDMKRIIAVIKDFLV